MEKWQRKALGQLAEHFNLQLIEDAMCEPTLFSIGHVSLTPPRTSENDSAKWLTGIVTVIPGVWRTRNGDGWPDDVDYSDDGEFALFEEAACRVGELLGRWLADSLIEDAQCEQTVQELDEDQRFHDREAAKADRDYDDRVDRELEANPPAHWRQDSGT